MKLPNGNKLLKEFFECRDKEVQERLNKVKGELDKRDGKIKPNNPNTVNKGTPRELPKQYSKANITTQETPDSVEEEDDQSDDDSVTEEEITLLRNALLTKQDTVQEFQSYFKLNMAYTTIDSWVNLDWLSKVFCTTNGFNYVIVDGGADTSVVGTGWIMGEIQSGRKANLVGFDPNHTKKFVLDIGTA